MESTKTTDRVYILFMTVLIPFIFVGTYKLMHFWNVPSLGAQIIVQLTTFVMMLPYFILKRKNLFKISGRIFSNIIFMFFIMVGVYYIISINLGAFLIYTGLHASVISTIPVVVLAPIIEEMYYRGIVQDCLDCYLPTMSVSNCLAGAAYFGASHVRYWGSSSLILVTFIGLLSSLLLKRYKNIYPSIFFHAFWNWIQTFLRLFSI